LSDGFGTDLCFSGSGSFLLLTAEAVVDRKNEDTEHEANGCGDG